MSKKKTITAVEYLQIVGLLTLAKEHNSQLRSILKSISKMVGEDDDMGGHTGDTVYSHIEQNSAPAAATILLTNLGLTVKEATT